jgi:hypothetical protein
MSQVIPDYRHVDACLEESDSTAVPHHVRRNADRAQVWQRLRGAVYVFVKDVGNTVATHRSTSRVSKNGFIFGVGVDYLAQCCGGFWPQGTQALFPAFAEQTHLPRRIKMKLSHTNVQGFADPGAGIVEEQQKRSIPY